MAVIRDVMPAFRTLSAGVGGRRAGAARQYGADAWVMAGGLDSFDWLKDRIKRPKVVVDLSQVKELRGVRDVGRRRRNRRHDHADRSGAQPDRQARSSAFCRRARKPLLRRRFATRARSAATSRRTRAAGITAAAGRAIARAETSATPIRRRPSIASTRFWARTAAWP